MLCIFNIEKAITLNDVMAKLNKMVDREGLEPPYP